jgi:hypothetical protein
MDGCLSSAALLATLIADQATYLPQGHRRKKTPQSTAIHQIWKSAVLGISAKAVDGAQSDILFVSDPRMGAGKLISGQADETMEISFPDLLRGSGVSMLEPSKPLGYRTVGKHGPLNLKKNSIIGK